MRMESKNRQKAGQDSREHMSGEEEAAGRLPVIAVSMWSYWRLLRRCSLNKVRLIRARSARFKQTRSKIYTAGFLLVLKSSDRRKRTLLKVSTILPLLNWASATLKTLKSLKHQPAVVGSASGRDARCLPFRSLAVGVVSGQRRRHFAQTPHALAPVHMGVLIAPPLRT